MPNPNLDSAGLRILQVLQSEGRISNLDLAERIGLSATPCSRRVKRLEESGVITSYGARINPDALGLDISALITIRLSSQTPDDIDEFLTAINALVEVTECLLVAGNHDYVLRVRVGDVHALRDFILNGLKVISCVSETSTVLMLDSVKSVHATRLNVR